METLLTEDQAAEKIGVAPRTLSNWRYTGKGPQYIRLSHRAVRYHPEDIEDWIEKRVYRSTSAESAENT